MVKFAEINYSSSKEMLVTEAHITTWMNRANRNGNIQHAGSELDIPNCGC
jgi:hypothetical protein